MGLFSGGIFNSINKGLTSLWKGHVNAGKIGLAAAFPGAGSYMSQQEANEANKRLQREANAANVALWERQTAYNSPAEQMTRLQQAGLNPHLAYGQVADSKMASAPTMEAPRMEAPEWKGSSALEMLSTFQQVMNLQAMNQKIRLDNLTAAQEYKMRDYEYGTLKSRGQTRHDAGLIKEILGALDLLTRAGSVARDRSPRDFVHLKKDNR